MEEYKPLDVPMSPKIKLEINSKSQLVDATTYRQLIGNLIYLNIPLAKYFLCN